MRTLLYADLDDAFDSRLKTLELGSADVTFEDAALDVVEILAAGPQDLRVALGERVVHDDDVHRHHQIRNGRYGVSSRQVRVSWSASR